MAKYRTEQRKKLQELFIGHPHEIFSAREIMMLLKNDSVSISAIYRNLSDLEKTGLLQRVVKKGSRETFYRYTAIEDCRDHIHLTCKKCGKTFHMALEDMDALTHCISKYRNFILDKTDTVIFGFCESCQGL